MNALRYLVKPKFLPQITKVTVYFDEEKELVFIHPEYTLFDGQRFSGLNPTINFASSHEIVLDH